MADLDLPLLSVVIPSFNYGRFLPETLDSCLQQTYTNFEVLVVDGGSTCQDTLALLRGIHHPKISVHLRYGRHLVGSNRNHGIERARGRYICCLDSDDRVRPTYFERAIELLDGQDYDIVSTAIQTFGDDSSIYPVEPFPTLNDMVKANHVATCAVFRRLLWERHGGFVDSGLDERYFYEDWRLWIRFAALGARIANLVEEPLFEHRVHAGSLSRSNPRIPSMAAQRAAILAFNADVLGPMAGSVIASRDNVGALR
jgi:glycosyltransferase involved in cell wall biosynthesis